MKSRIGKLEGDSRTAKRLQESLGKHVKLLEYALKRERDQLKKSKAGESVEDKPTTAEGSRSRSKDTKGKLLSYCLLYNKI